MLNQLRAEWLKLARRPMTLILLVVFLLLVVLVLSLDFAVVALARGTFNNVQAALFPAEQIEQYHLQLRFPGIFGAILGQVNATGGICAIILTAGALGSEYSWGTLRAQLARQPSRTRFLSAKLMAIMLLLLLAVLIALVLGALLALLYGTVLGDVGSIGAGDLLRLPLCVVRALYVLLPYVLLTAACCTLGRSVLAGTAGGMIFLTTDVVLGGLSFLPSTGGLLAFIYSLLVQQNINTLVVANQRAFGLDPVVSLSRFLDLAILPPQSQAILVIAVYCASFAAAAYGWLLRRDLTGAT